MRLAILAIATAVLLLTPAVQAPFAGLQAFAATADHPAAKKMHKHAREKPKEKVEFMRAVPWQ